jgi:hypothetical protein
MDVKGLITLNPGYESYMSGWLSHFLVLVGIVSFLYLVWDFVGKTSIAVSGSELPTICYLAKILQGFLNGLRTA